MKKIILFVLVWYVIGVHGFIHWYTSDHAFTNKQVPLAIAAGLTGPFVHALGWSIHSKTNTIIIPKRDN